MDARTRARQTAWAIIDNLLESYFDVGQPWTECAKNAEERGEDHPNDCPDCRQLAKALRAIQDVAHRRGRDTRTAPPPPTDREPK
jgi:hypothetical protein